MANQKAFNQFLVQIAETAIRSREPTGKVGEEAEMRPNRSGPVTLLPELCDVRLDVRTQWSGVQSPDGFEFSE